MTPTAKTILREALKLPRVKRARLLEAVVHSLVLDVEAEEKAIRAAEARRPKRRR